MSQDETKFGLLNKPIFIFTSRREKQFYPEKAFGNASRAPERSKQAAKEIADQSLLYFSAVVGPCSF
jgi:hypothetical protein